MPENAGISVINVLYVIFCFHYVVCAQACRLRYLFCSTALHIFTTMSAYIDEISNRLPGCLFWDRLLIYHHKGDANIGSELDKPARIDAYMMVLCTKGNIVVESNHKEYSLHSGSAFFSGPHTLLNATIVNDAEAYVVVMQSDKFIETIGSSVFALRAFDLLYVKPLIDLDDKHITIIQQAVNALENVIRSKISLFKKEILNSLLTAFLYIFAEIANDYDIEHKGHVLDTNTNLFLRFIKLLAENYSVHRDVSFYADELCLSPRYLTTVVRKVSGSTISEWISRLIINDAKYLLKYTELSVKEIAYKLNFPNNSFFCKYFKKHTGMTPMGYRKTFVV